MAEDKNIFDHWLKQKVSESSVPASPLSWEEMSSAMDTPKRKKFAWVWWAAALIVLGTGILLFSSRNPKSQRTETSQTPSLVTKPSQTEQNTTDNKKVKEPTNTIVERSKRELPLKEQDQTMNLFDGKDNKILGKQENNQGAVSKTDDRSETSGEHTSLGTNGKGTRFYSPVYSPLRPPKRFSYNYLITLPTEQEFSRTRDLETPSKWELGFSFSPALGVTLLKESKEFGWLVNKNFNEINENSVQGAAAYQAAFKLNRYIGKKELFYAGTGLNYTQRTERVSYDHIVKEGVHADYTKKELLGPFLWPQFMWEHVKYDGVNTYHFVQIPVHLGILVPVTNNWKVRAQVGGNYSYTLGVAGNKISPTYLTLRELNSMTKHNVVGHAEAGLYWTATSQLDFGATPFYQRMLTGLTTGNNGLVENPAMFGFNFNVHYKLNKR